MISRQPPSAVLGFGGCVVCECGLEQLLSAWPTCPRARGVVGAEPQRCLRSPCGIRVTCIRTALQVISVFPRCDSTVHYDSMSRRSRDEGNLLHREQISLFCRLVGERDSEHSGAAAVRDHPTSHAGVSRPPDRLCVRSLTGAASLKPWNGEKRLARRHRTGHRSETTCAVGFTCRPRELCRQTAAAGHHFLLLLSKQQPRLPAEMH